MPPLSGCEQFELHSVQLVQPDADFEQFEMQSRLPVEPFQYY
jgi:hypothetical protein